MSFTSREWIAARTMDLGALACNPAELGQTRARGVLKRAFQ